MWIAVCNMCCPLSILQFCGKLDFQASQGAPNPLAKEYALNDIPNMIRGITRGVGLLGVQVTLGGGMLGHQALDFIKPQALNSEVLLGTQAPKPGITDVDPLGLVSGIWSGIVSYRLF